jgi:hypothetical protein
MWKNLSVSSFMRTPKAFFLVAVALGLSVATLAFAGGHGASSKPQHDELMDGDTINIAGDMCLGLRSKGELLLRRPLR